MKHLQQDRELFERAMDRIWQRSQEDADRLGQRFESDQTLMARARLKGWKPPAERVRKVVA